MDPFDLRYLAMAGAFLGFIGLIEFVRLVFIIKKNRMYIRKNLIWAMIAIHQVQKEEELERVRKKMNRRICILYLLAILLHIPLIIKF